MILAIVQARMSSSRLPGKVLKPLAGAPSLARQLERIERARKIDHVMVATSRNREDDVIAGLCRDLATECFRGSLENVLERYYQAAKRHQPDHVVRLTADCPMTDWRLIDDMIDDHCRHGNDYSGIGMPRSYPKGLDAEIMTFAALEAAWRDSNTPYQREHVTPFLYQHKDRFRMSGISQARDWSKLRWTLDTPADYAMIAAVYEALYPSNPAFNREEIMAFLLDHPQVRELNADDEAKALYDALAKEAAAGASSA